jgi:hypothetical protein
LRRINAPDTGFVRLPTRPARAMEDSMLGKLMAGVLPAAILIPV